MNDYIITMDRYGQPYIAHGNNQYVHMYSSPGAPHKYVIRINDPNHIKKYKYFYSIEEYQAYLENQKKKENEKVRKEQAKTEKRLKKAKKAVNTVKETNEKLGKDVLYTDPFTKKKVTKRDLLKFLLSGAKG